MESHMLKIENQKQYNHSLKMRTLYLFLAFAIIQMVKPAFFFNCILFLIIETMVVSIKFTQSLIIEPSGLTINYFHFFSAKKITIPLEMANFKLIKTGSFRSPSYYVLKIMEGKRKVHEIDSRDGIQENDLKQILAFVNGIKPAT